MHRLQPSGSPQQMAMAPTIWLKKKRKTSSNTYWSVPFIYHPLSNDIYHNSHYSILRVSL